MNLYRIDILYPEASVPLSDMLGTRLIRSSSDARIMARQASARTCQAVAVTRIQGAGMLKHIGTYYPDGSFDRFGPAA